LINAYEQKAIVEKLGRGTVRGLDPGEEWDPMLFAGYGAEMARIRPRTVPAWVLEAEKRGEVPGLVQHSFLAIDGQFLETTPDPPLPYLMRNVPCPGMGDGVRAVGVTAYVMPSELLADWLGDTHIEDAPPRLLVGSSRLVAVVPILTKTVGESLKDTLYQALLDRGAEDLFESYKPTPVTPIVCEPEYGWTVDPDLLRIARRPTKKKPKKKKKKRRR
jgi:hypothetical protein